MGKKSGRSANGMGSIRQRSDGRWEGRYSDPNGVQRSVYGKTQKEVTTKLKAAQREVDTGNWREPSKLTVGEWLDIWLSDYQADNSERTVLKYRSIVNHNFKPTLGDVKLTKLSPIHIRRAISSMQAKGLSQVTISNYCRILRTSLKRAVEVKLIKANPMSDISVSRGKVKAFHIIDKELFPAFIEAARQTRYDNELIFMLYTGMRIGEVRGLRWDDINFDKGTMFIQRQLHPRSQLTKRITAPKYDEERLVHLPKNAMDVLRAQRKKQAEQRISMGESWQEDEISQNLVFRMDNGRPHGEKTIMTAVKRVGEKIGIPELHPHDLRHTYAVTALRAGMDVKTVQHNLGHKDASMTLNVYVAYTDDAGQEGAKKLSEYLETVPN